MIFQILGLGPSEMVIIILVVVLLILGPQKIPALFKALGQSVGEFKKGARESEEEDSKARAKAKKKKAAPKEEEKEE